MKRQQRQDKKGTRGKEKRKQDFIGKDMNGKGKESLDSRGKGTEGKAQARKTGGDHICMAKAIRDTAMPVRKFATKPMREWARCKK